MKNTNHESEAPTGNLKFGDKQDVAAMLGICRRSVDNEMAKGMPHLKMGKRRCRFDLAEVAAWVKDRYGVSRIGKERVQ